MKNPHEQQLKGRKTRNSRVERSVCYQGEREGEGEGKGGGRKEGRKEGWMERIAEGGIKKGENKKKGGRSGWENDTKENNIDYIKERNIQYTMMTPKK